MYKIEPISKKYREFVDKQIADGWAGPFIVTKGVLHDTRTHPGFAAIRDDIVSGYILYNLADQELEITVLESLQERQGVGNALVKSVIQEAQKAGLRRVWLISTNDNTHAIRFYQRIGFSLRAVHIDAIKTSRKLKPEIPLTGYDGISIAHEFEFEMFV